jgi:hypothetical protein
MLLWVRHRREFDVNDARAYAGMSWLHGASPPVLHLDLKPANLLVDEQWHAKVRTRRACVRRPRVLMARLTRRSVTLAWRVTSAPRSRAASARRYTWHLRCVCVMHDVRCDVTRVYVPQVLKGEAYDESADGMTPAPSHACVVSQCGCLRCVTVYSFGIVAWELHTTEPPFGAQFSEFTGALSGVAATRDVTCARRSRQCRRQSRAAATSAC